MAIITARARAYVNHGRWIADCPVDCGGALILDKGQTQFPCPECLTITAIEWPKDPQGIWDALSKRMSPKTRNWYPEDHNVAVRACIPHGQTVDDLERETKERS